MKAYLQALFFRLGQSVLWKLIDRFGFIEALIRAVGYGIENRDRCRPPPYVFTHYDDDAYSATTRYSDLDIESKPQFRTLLEMFDLAAKRNPTIKSACEIGASSGDLSCYLARKYPGI